MRYILSIKFFLICLFFINNYIFSFALPSRYVLTKIKIDRLRVDNVLILYQKLSYDSDNKLIGNVNGRVYYSKKPFGKLNRYVLAEMLSSNEPSVSFTTQDKKTGQFFELYDLYSILSDKKLYALWFMPQVIDALTPFVNISPSIYWEYNKEVSLDKDGNKEVHFNYIPPKFCKYRIINHRFTDYSGIYSAFVIDNKVFVDSKYFRLLKVNFENKQYLFYYTKPIRIKEYKSNLYDRYKELYFKERIANYVVVWDNNIKNVYHLLGIYVNLKKLPSFVRNNL